MSKRIFVLAVTALVLLAGVCQQTVAADEASEAIKLKMLRDYGKPRTPIVGEIPQAAVRTYLQQVKAASGIFVRRDADGKINVFEVRAANGEPMQDQPYITDIALVESQPGPEQVEQGKAQVWRVVYVVQTRLPHEYAERRLAFLSKERAFRQKALRNKDLATRRAIDQLFRGSIERVRAERYLVHATITVERAPAGWQLMPLAQAQIDTDLQAWALDNTWNPIEPYNSRVTGLAG